MAKILVFGPILAPLAKIWIPKTFFMDFTYIRCYALLQDIIVCNLKKTNEPHFRKWQKT